MSRPSTPFIARVAALLTATVLFTSAGAMLAPTAIADPGDTVTISMRALHLNPAELDITTGTTVIWKNDELFDYPVASGDHRIVADDGSFDSGMIAAQASWSLDFLEPRSVSYYCALHPQLMEGTIDISGPPVKLEPTERTVKIVEPSSAPESWTYSPEEILVTTGTTITWRNEGATIHTVTAKDGSFDSGNMQPGESFTKTFDAPTALRYNCTPHPWMEGLLQVAEAGGPAPLPPPEPGGSGSGPDADVPVSQPVRSGDGPVTIDVSAVEPDLANPDSWSFAPAAVNARVGDTIVWTNQGSIVHTATEDAGGFDSGDLAPGDTFALELTETGSLSYACEPHPWMTGTIVVQAAGAPLVPAPAEGPVVPGPSDEAPGTPADEGDEPMATDGRRVAFAGAVGGVVLLLTLLLVLPSLMTRRPRPAADPPNEVIALDEPAAPAEEMARDQRELVGAGRR